MATLLTETRPARTPAGQASPVAPPAPADRPARLVSLDAYRGFIMLAMASGGLYLSGVVHQFDFATLASSTLWLAGSPGPGLVARGRPHQLRVPQRPGPDRPGLRVRLPAGGPWAPCPTGRARRHPGRLHPAVRALPLAGAGVQLRGRGRQAGLAPPDGL